MIVKDLLNRCNKDELLKATAAIYNSCDREKPLDRVKFDKAHHEIFDKLSNMEPVEKDPDQWIIVGMYLSMDGIKSLGPELYKLTSEEGIYVKLDHLTDIESISPSVLKNRLLTNDELKEFYKQAIEGNPQAWSYSMTPWNEVLAFQVDEKNIEDVGAENLMAAIIYEITFYGFDEDQIEVERQKLQEAVDELESIKALPEEEQEKHFKSADEVFKELGVTDERTEEEKEKDMLDMYWEGLENAIRIRQTLSQLAVLSQLPPPNAFGV